MKLNKQSKFILDLLKYSCKRLKKTKGGVAIVTRIEDKLAAYIGGKSKFYQLRPDKKKIEKQKIKEFKKSSNAKIIACRINGSKGGQKTAMLYDKNKRREWNKGKAGETTAMRMGNGFYKHISKIGLKKRRSK